MLRLTRRGEVAEFTELTVDEDRKIGAVLVRRHQHPSAGRRFLCDSLGDVPRLPALIPVMENHFRRHTEVPWPAHDPACDFYRD